MSRPPGASDSRDGKIAVNLDADLLRQLRPSAAARGTTAQQLVRDIIRITVADKLTDAILDDQK